MSVEKEFEFPEYGDLQFLQWQNTSPNFKWFYTPHRFIFIFIFILFFLVVQPTKPLYQLFSFWFIITFFIATCVQDGPLVRPHPFFLAICINFHEYQWLLFWTRFSSIFPHQNNAKSSRRHSSRS